MAVAPLLSRLTTLQAHLPPKTGWLITSPYDIAYYTGFQCLVPEERDALLIVLPDFLGLMYATFSPIETAPEIQRLAGCSPTKVVEHLQVLRAEHPFEELWIDPQTLLVAEYQQLQSLGVVLKNGDKKPIWQQRLIKDEHELQAARRAGVIAKSVIKDVQASLEVGMTERDVQQFLDIKLRQLGAQKEAFPTIVAFGANSALPHHQPTKLELTPETPVLIDFGVVIDGYLSDMTRTSWFGQQPSESFQAVEKIVHEAYAEAFIRAQTWPMTAADVDLAARNLITEATYGKQFIHTTGHGIGLEIHEPPSVNWQNPTPLSPGMLITIEPGIYLEGQFGYRYENTIELTPDGAVELTK